MFLNVRHCFKQYVPLDKNFYLEIRNESSFFINILLYYTFHSKRSIKPTSVFGPGKMQRVVFPGDAIDVYFDIYNCFFLPPAIICHKSIPNQISSCFKVTGNQQGYIQCTPVPC